MGIFHAKMSTIKNRRGKIRDLFRKTGNIKGTFLLKMAIIKDKNGGDLVDTGEIKMRWKYTEELYKKGLNEPDCCDGDISHPGSDILECKVK